MLDASTGNSLFESVVQTSGLASVFASAVIARALGRVGINVKTLTRQDLARAIPALEQALLIYLPQPEVRTRLAAIERLAGVERGR